MGFHRLGWGVPSPRTLLAYVQVGARNCRALTRRVPMEPTSTHTKTLFDYLSVLARRKWVIIEVAVAVPVATVLLSLNQQKLYSASAEVLLERQSASSLIDATTDPFASDPFRFLQNQASGRAPSRQLRARRQPHGGPALASSSVTPRDDSDLLDFQVTDVDSGVAAKLAGAYARQFTEYRRELDAERFRSAIRQLDREIAELQASGASDSSAFLRSLLDSRNELRRLETLQSSNALVLSNPTAGAQIAPTPRRDGILSLGLGLFLGVGLAFLWEALSIGASGPTRRSSASSGCRCWLDWRSPTASSRSATASSCSPTPTACMPRRIASSARTSSSPIWPRARSILVTSALQREGKSTTIANLAVSFARSGKHVILVDLDLRRPMVERFFNIHRRSGVTDVALGRLTLEEALVEVEIPSSGDGLIGGNGRKASAIGEGRGGVLEVLPCGTIPLDAGEFVGTDRLAGMIAAIEDRADVVLIDAPPALAGGDALALSARVDAMIIIVRIGMITRPTLRELARCSRLRRRASSASSRPASASRRLRLRVRLGAGG